MATRECLKTVLTRGHKSMTGEGHDPTGVILDFCTIRYRIKVTPFSRAAGDVE